MVNCKNCGAPLSLNDAYCPHCGTPNPEAQEHLKKLAALDREFQKTQIEVTNEVRKSKKGYNLLVILVMVLLANLAFIPLHMASYDIAEKVIASRMNEAEIREKLDTFLEEGEFIEMSIFLEKYHLPYQEYGEYNRLSYMADYYSRLIENITDHLYSSENYSDPLVRACQNILDFKQSYQSYLKWSEDTDMTKYARQINDDFDAVLKVYLKLTDEDIAKIPDMSSSALLLKVNERLNDEKE